MGEGDGMRRISRRTFLKTGIVATASSVIGGDAFADGASKPPSAPFAFPAPVYRTLGRTGLRVTVVSFGAMLTPEPEVIRIAFENGVNYVDTARRYMSGKNEEIVAKALKGMRDKVFVATKTLPDSKSKTEIIRDVETSLKALGTDYVDVIQLHNLTDRDRIFIAETREALVALRQQGKVRFFGVTTHKNQAEVLNALVDDKDRFFDTALVAYNFKSGADIAAAIERAAAAGVGIVAMKTQAGGYDTATAGGISPHQAALKWVLRNPRIANAIPGMKDVAQLKEDVAVMGMSFTRADARALRRYAEAISERYCSLCGTCEAGCPRGVEIGTVNRALMYAEGYRSPALAAATYRELPAAASAAACAGCAQCTATCVNGLDIAAKMKRAARLLG